MKVAIVVTALLSLSHARPVKRGTGTETGIATGTLPYEGTLPDFTPPPPSPASQFHFAFDGGSGVTVSWSSSSEVKDPTVWYSQDGIFWQPSFPGTSTTFPSATVWDNHVSIPNLEPLSKYYYKVSGQPDDFDPVGNDFFFTTARPAGNREEYSIAIYGDLGANMDDSGADPISNTMYSLLASKGAFESFTITVIWVTLMITTMSRVTSLILTFPRRLLTTM
jgi:hypothetical protein